jgi:hypothetical protein
VSDGSDAVPLVEVCASADDEKVLSAGESNRANLPGVPIKRGLAKTRNVAGVDDRECFSEGFTDL